MHGHLDVKLNKVIEIKINLKVLEKFNEEVDNYLVLTEAGWCNLLVVLCAQECALQAEEFLVSSYFLLQMTEGGVIATPITLSRIQTNASLEM